MRVGVLVVLAVLVWWAVGLGHLHVNVKSSPKLARLDRASGLAPAARVSHCTTVTTHSLNNKNRHSSRA
jgi:hypothetical protein